MKTSTQEIEQRTRGRDNDVLKGGAGDDTFTGNYGIDMVSDSDGAGTLIVAGQTLTGATTQTAENIYQDSNNIYLKLNGGNSLVMFKENESNRIIVNDWSSGNDATFDERKAA